MLNTIPGTPLATASTPGAMSASDAVTVSQLALAGALDGGAALSAGNLYRLVSAGSVTKAIADTLAHVAGIVGVSDVNGRIQSTGNVPLVFDAAPVVNSPAYPSRTVAGAGSNTATAFGVLPIGLVVADLSVGSAYKALVQMPYVPVIHPASMREQLDLETLSVLGGAAVDWEDAIWDDFGQVNTDGAGKRCPLWGNQSAATWADSKASCVTMAASNKQWYLGATSWVKTGVSILSYPWHLSVRLQEAVNGWGKTQLDLYTAAGHNYVEIGGDYSTGWRLNYGTQSHTTTVTIGANDGTSLYQLGVASKGDGSLIWRFNYGPWSSPIADEDTAAMAAAATTAGVLYMAYSSNIAMTIDHLYFRAKR